MFPSQTVCLESPLLFLILFLLLLNISIEKKAESRTFKRSFQKMSDSSILVKQFDGSNYSQYFPQNVPPDIANQFVNSEGKNSNNIFNYLRKYC